MLRSFENTVSVAGVTRMLRIGLVLAAALCLPATTWAAAGAQPVAPALVARSSPPFAVTGLVRFTHSAGVAFRVATDGKRQLCTLYDPSDGTALFLSDGQQTLVYDLPCSRTVRVPNSRGYVRLD
jgi:hypothetical protein